MEKLKELENKEKSRFARVKDFFKDKLSVWNVKGKMKKIAAGGLIATSLFLRQPVMADENELCSKIIAAELYEKQILEDLLNNNDCSYTARQIDSGVFSFQAECLIDEDIVCINRIINDPTMQKFGNIYVFEMTDYSFTFGTIKQIILRKSVSPVVSLPGGLNQIYINDNNNSVFSVFMISKLPQLGIIKIVIDYYGKPFTTSVYIKLSPKFKELYGKYIADVNKGVVYNDDNVSLGINIEPYTTTEDSNTDCSEHSSLNSCTKEEYIIKISFSYGNEYIKEEYLLRRRGDEWRVEEHYVPYGFEREVEF